MVIKIAELRDKLENKYNHDVTELHSMRKKALLNLLNNYEHADVTLSNVHEGPEENNSDVSHDDENCPDITDPEWTDYVMTLFVEAELEKQMPRVDGLRRIARKLLGHFSIQTNVVQAPTISNRNHATVSVSLNFANGSFYQSAADVCIENTQKEYAIHSVATAETRAEGRALRKALGLNKILSAEELTSPDRDERVDSDSHKLTAEFLNSLGAMCKKQKIDLFKLIVAKVDSNIAMEEDLTIKQGQEILSLLHAYRIDKEEIPENVKMPTDS